MQPRRALRSMIFRALLVWLLIFAVEVVHGVLRTLWLVPLVGDLPARQIGVLVGSLLILLAAWLCIDWIGARGRRELLGVGLSWLLLMLVAEITLGRFVFGYPWLRIAEDFDPTRGGILGLGMLVLFAAPWLARRWRPGPRDEDGAPARAAGHRSG
ncbi:MAG: hypothetical protein OEW34_11900 [Burkholderiaceae bacterium]|nr:hypothetical protein [Burkholderiaceae bacterium]